MRARFIGATVVALLASAFVAASPAQAAAGIRVSGTNIVEANGSNFIMRGTSHAHTWYPSQTSSFANIKAAGANTARVVLSGGRWTANGVSDVANVVSLCKQNRLICVLENHDTTGYGEQSGAYTMTQAVQYWNSVKSALVGQENYVIINIGNEPFGNGSASNDWPTETANAIRAMRSNGFEHALMVDAPNWGQDWQFIMRDNAQTVAAADSQKNTIFSIHMYGVFDTASEVTSYVSAFRTMGLPLVIGEFGHNHSDGNPDEVTIMQQSIGWLGWSWSGNGGEVEYLDQVTNFDPNQMTSWGTQLFSDPASAREASIYSGQTQTTADHDHHDDGRLRRPPRRPRPGRLRRPPRPGRLRRRPRRGVGQVHHLLGAEPVAGRVRGQRQRHRGQLGDQRLAHHHDPARNAVNNMWNGVNSTSGTVTVPARATTVASAPGRPQLRLRRHRHRSRSASTAGYRVPADGAVQRSPGGQHRPTSVRAPRDARNTASQRPLGGSVAPAERSRQLVVLRRRSPGRWCRRDS